MGALLLTAGATGSRYALPHCKNNDSSALRRFSRPKLPILIFMAREILRVREELNTIMV